MLLLFAWPTKELSIPCHEYVYASFCPPFYDSPLICGLFYLVQCRYEACCFSPRRARAVQAVAAVALHDHSWFLISLIPRQSSVCLCHRVVEGSYSRCAACDSALIGSSFLCGFVSTDDSQCRTELPGEDANPVDAPTVRDHCTLSRRTRS